MRRRTLPSTVDGQPVVPAELRRFAYADWHDDADLVPPPHWSNPREWPEYRHVRAFRRFLDARRVWEAETGVHIVRSWEAWAEERRRTVRTLADLNEPYAAEHFVEGEDVDPRLGEV